MKKAVSVLIALLLCLSLLPAALADEPADVIFAGNVPDDGLFDSVTQAYTDVERCSLTQDNNGGRVALPVSGNIAVRDGDFHVFADFLLCGGHCHA